MTRIEPPATEKHPSATSMSGGLQAIPETAKILVIALAKPVRLK
jgi:hypothetical protein